MRLSRNARKCEKLIFWRIWQKNAIYVFDESFVNLTVFDALNSRKNQFFKKKFILNCFHILDQDAFFSDEKVWNTILFIH